MGSEMCIRDSDWANCNSPVIITACFVIVQIFYQGNDDTFTTSVTQLSGKGSDDYDMHDRPTIKVWPKTRQPWPGPMQPCPARFRRPRPGRILGSVASPSNWTDATTVNRGSYINQGPMSAFCIPAKGPAYRPQMCSAISFTTIPPAEL